MFRSVLVANRGEIAVRVFRTCRRLGIRTVGVYSDADAQALHVSEADAAYRIGPPPAPDSYLKQAAILDAAKSAGAEAIHPGYGFLAENADFAQAVIDAGYVWVGPPPAAMRALGDKARAKALAEQHDVPLLAGYHGRDSHTPEALEAHASRIGYPILIKASAGGGGRGMRVVDRPADFAEALEAARREALQYFGDDQVLLERYLEKPRHVEVQIVGDLHGTLVHLGERECSVQRRHQKLIEETPSPAVDADLRSAMGEAALRLARAAGYASTGTVEFLLDEAGRFAFLEVNARLQVEHPVTEAITGLDLVELQLRVAAGEPLPFAQQDVTFDGHAIEARLIAEDALTGFLPSSGTVETFETPDFVRVDTWIQPGTRVSPYYDSLLAKIIAHAPDRSASVRRLAHALQEVRMTGLQDNVDVLLAVIEHPRFLRGDLHTRFLDEHQIVESVAEVPPPVLAAATAVDFLTTSPGATDPWRAHSGWRMGRIQQPARWTRAGRTHGVSASADLDGAGLRLDADPPAGVRVLGATLGSRTRMGIDNQAATVLERGADWRIVEWQGRSFRLRRSPPLTVEETAGERGAGAAGRLTAPMPGRIVKLTVQAGQQVVQNEPLVVLEAMKMEHVLEAPHAGIVTEVCVAVGQQVTGGAQLLVLGSADVE